jgi:hypothetical protein
MAEVKERINLVIELFTGKFPLPEQMAFELCYLQLRMVCELIALGCLAVHGDSPGTRTARIRTAHQADFILNTLESLHPKFYPVPGLLAPHPKGQAFIVSNEDYMTKEELLALYWRCGDHLHRGTFRTMKALKQIDWDTIETSVKKLTSLLKFHRIAFINSEDELWVSVGDPPHSAITNPKGAVVATLQRPVND